MYLLIEKVLVYHSFFSASLIGRSLTKLQQFLSAALTCQNFYPKLELTASSSGAFVQLQPSLVTSLNDYVIVNVPHQCVG